jgi:hypothetical protein
VAGHVDKPSIPHSHCPSIEYNIISFAPSGLPRLVVWPKIDIFFAMFEVAAPKWIEQLMVKPIGLANRSAYVIKCNFSFHEVEFQPPEASYRIE